MRYFFDLVGPRSISYLCAAFAREADSVRSGTFHVRHTAKGEADRVHRSDKGKERGTNAVVKCFVHLRAHQDGRARQEGAA